MAISVPIIFTVFLFLYFLIWWVSKSILRSSSDREKSAPEAGGSWPLIGHLLLLGGSKPPHRVLGDMADKYGPIFTMKMGVYPTLIVSNWEIAKECFTRNDKAFSGRPKALAMEILGYDSSMFGLSPYGPYWRQMRKIVTLELLSNQRLETFKHVRESEVRTFLKELHKLWEKEKSNSNNNKVVVEMMKWFGDVTLNVVLRIIVGKTVGYVTAEEEGEEKKVLKQKLREFFELMGGFVVSDALPFLRGLDIGGKEKAMKKTAKELDRIVVEWLDEHKSKRVSRGGSGERSEEDFMDLMLTVFEDSQLDLDGRDSDTVIKANCLGLTLAGFDTTTVTLTWALSLLLNNPDVMKKAQLELDTCVGKARQVQESDLKNLVYLNAVLKETQRLYPAGPVAIPHECMENCTLGGYHVPVGTRLITNIWKIQHDPIVWPEPFKFQPERFLTTHKDFDVRGQNFELIPFGSGRRVCPGASLALQVIHLSLATLLHGFDIETVSGGPVDMEEGTGLTNIKATPLEVLFMPRLAPNLYT